VDHLRQVGTCDAPVARGRGGRRGTDPRGGCRAARRRIIATGIGGRRGGARRALEEVQAGLFLLEVSSTFTLRFLFCSAIIHLLSFIFAVRASPAVPALALVKALKLRTSLVMGGCSERALRVATSVVEVSESLHTTASTARLRQQKDMAAAVAQVPATHDPHQGHGRTRMESHGARGRGATETPAGDDSARQGSRSHRNPCW
jgi:hypothetical protein